MLFLSNLFESRATLVCALFRGADEVRVERASGIIGDFDRTERFGMSILIVTKSSTWIGFGMSSWVPAQASTP
jgi:hypothetical protein